MENKKEKQYVSDNEKLISEWNWEKNTDITPDKITCGSNKKVWWKCSKGHEWQTSVICRSKKKGTNCPYCSGNKVLTGVNDLATMFPHIAEEWHPTKNGDLTPSLIAAKSSKRVWWRCSKGHEWKISVSNRTGNKSGCPYCKGKKAFVGYNDLATVNPVLAEEWHPTKNGTLTPESVVAGSDKSVWWRCKRGHEWKAVIKQRHRGDGCPYCSGRLPIVGETDLATVYPDIAAEWHPVKNGHIMPTDVTAKSSKKFWWKCKEGHEWETSPEQRQRAGCPYCGNKKVLRGYNDLATTHPELAAQWHPTKNGKLTAEMVSYGSTQHVWWQCEKGHEWYASPNGRTNKEGHTLLNCPICSSELKTSFAEQAIFYYLKMHTEAYNRCQVQGKELDIWLPLFNIGIEHDGIYYHQNEEKDNTKKRFFLEHGIQIITVRESKRETVDKGVIEYDYRDLKSLNNAIETILGSLKIASKVHINVEKDSIDIQNQYVNMTKENSLAKQYPNLAAEWHPTKNRQLTPDQFSCGSHKKVWWLGNCGHEWQAVIKNRVASGAGCPVCAGKVVLEGVNDLKTLKPDVANLWHPVKNGTVSASQVTPFSSKKAWWMCEKGHEWYATISGVSGGARCPYCANQKVWPGYNDFGTTHPELAAEWHPTLNGDLKPQNVTYGSTKSVWWKCKEGHEWKQTLNSRTNGSGKCPECSKKRDV